MNVKIIDLGSGDVFINFGGEFAHIYPKIAKSQILKDLAIYEKEQTCESWDNNEIEYWEEAYQDDSTDELTVDELMEELEIMTSTKMTHKINIRETLERVIDIEAGSAEEALLIAKARYDNGDIVLDSEDFKGVEFYDMGLPKEALQDKPKDSFDIYQLKDEPQNRYLRFESYKRLKAAGHEVKRFCYELVYSAELLPCTGLDDIYTRFNINRPGDFKGHSLSVSDVIVIHRNGMDTAHYVDSFGFKDIPEFLSPYITGEIINRTKGEELTR